MIGFALVMFWVFTAIFVGPIDLIATFDPVSNPPDLQRSHGPEERRRDCCTAKVWGTATRLIIPYLLGGDNLASRHL
jgi:peptide/nickel transport system permease protein